jgi:hypothetical protein
MEGVATKEVIDMRDRIQSVRAWKPLLVLTLLTLLMPVVGEAIRSASGPIGLS